jgi:hypothetical protein
MISSKYFRFETWAEQSNYMALGDTRDLKAQNPAGPSSVSMSKRDMQLAEKALDIVVQVMVVLKEMCEVLAKYGVPDPSSELGNSVNNVGGPNATIVRTATEKVLESRQKLNQQTGRLKKFSFG